MSFASFVQAAFPEQSQTNISRPLAYRKLPATVLETFIPGYESISNFLFQTFGFDVTIFVSLGCVLWLLCKIGAYFGRHGYRLLSQWGMASITVNNIDNIHDHLMKWLSEHHSIKDSRSLSAETLYRSAWDEDVEEDESNNQNEDSKLLNFSDQEAKAPPRFIPYYGLHHFWHDGRLFFLRRIRQTSIDLNSFPSSFEKEDLTITCIGRSSQPIKNLLQVAKDFYLKSHCQKTTIRRPAPKDLRRYGGRSCWTASAHRPTRPMETVVLDAEHKRNVLQDMNEYLHPTTPRWYADRGIPYRRGYLFHGPPGTGKTSLSFALAGVFGLDIYVISLLDPSLTEEDLSMLFNALPRRCVVLLEDIDTAGLTRHDQPTLANPQDSETANSEWKVEDLARALKRASDASEDDKKKGISLSGLLNAIDGVASHEGRILVMTTNRPESLDVALIRPGRVDLQVPFGFATKTQIRELFVRMYSNEPQRKRLTRSPSSENIGKALPLLVTPAKSSQWINAASEPSGLTNQTDLLNAAEKFSGRVPEETFSPAEIQGFLLKRKKKPLIALEDIEGWTKSQLQAKADKKKVLVIQ